MSTGGLDWIARLKTHHVFRLVFCMHVVPAQITAAEMLLLLPCGMLPVSHWALCGVVREGHVGMR